MNNRLVTAPILALMAATAWAAPALADNTCRLYEHENFGGEELLLLDGQTNNFSSRDFWNDKISSIQLGEGCVIETFRDSGFDGDSVALNKSMQYVTDFWNDQISSVRCQC